MPGRVMAVRVRPGDRVAAGQEVCVVEAMKMEQSIRAHRDGVVKTIHVRPLDLVPARAPLVELE
jgi:propionyl-CoA carboxylase alpha chain